MLGPGAFGGLRVASHGQSSPWFRGAASQSTGRYNITRRGGRASRSHVRGSARWGSVALRFDPRAEDLEVEGPLVSDIQQHPHEPLHRDVTVADRRAIRDVEGAELVVADLHERHEVDVLAHDLLEAALVPRGVEVDDHAHAGHAREVDGVTNRVDEAHVGAERIGRLHGQPHAELVGACHIWSHVLAELRGCFLPRDRAGAPGHDVQHVGTDRGRELQRLRDAVLVARHARDAGAPRRGRLACPRPIRRRRTSERSTPRDRCRGPPRARGPRRATGSSNRCCSARREGAETCGS